MHAPRRTTNLLTKDEAYPRQRDSSLSEAVELSDNTTLTFCRCFLTVATVLSYTVSRVENRKFLSLRGGRGVSSGSSSGGQRGGQICMGGGARIPDDIIHD